MSTIWICKIWWRTYRGRPGGCWHVIGMSVYNSGGGQAKCLLRHAPPTPVHPLRPFIPPPRGTALPLPCLLPGSSGPLPCGSTASVPPTLPALYASFSIQGPSTTAPAVSPLRWFTCSSHTRWSSRVSPPPEALV